MSLICHGYVYKDLTEYAVYRGFQLQGYFDLQVTGFLDTDS
jgi:hypothetical protein